MVAYMASYTDRTPVKCIDMNHCITRFNPGIVDFKIS